jgi:hypothetical protein
VTEHPSSIPLQQNLFSNSQTDRQFQIGLAHPKTTRIVISPLAPAAVVDSLLGQYAIKKKKQAFEETLRHVRFQDLTAMSMKMTVFWDVVPGRK